MARMEERIGLLKREVEGRGFLWDRDTGDKGGDGDSEMMNGGEVGSGDHVVVNGAAVLEGRRGLGDEELARRLRERMEADNEEEDEGLHL